MPADVTHQLVQPKKCFRNLFMQDNLQFFRLLPQPIFRIQNRLFQDKTKKAYCIIFMHSIKCEQKLVSSGRTPRGNFPFTFTLFLAQTILSVGVVQHTQFDTNFTLELVSIYTPLTRDYIVSSNCNLDYVETGLQAADANCS